MYTVGVGWNWRYCGELKHWCEFKVRERNMDINVFKHVSERMHVHIHTHIPHTYYFFS